MSNQSKIRRGEPKPTGPPDCIFCGRPPHPDSFGHCYRPREQSQPKPTGEWTGLSLSRLIKEKGYKGSADAHNAALAAATDEAVDPAHQEILVLSQQLAAERERREQSEQYLQDNASRYEKDVEQLREQLAAAVEALKEAKKDVRGLTMSLPDIGDFEKLFSKKIDAALTRMKL